MEIYVACDVCGHRYVLAGDREGRKSKCKSCGVPFEVSADNFYDPETSEMAEESDDENSDSSINPVWEICKKIGHGIAALVTVTMLVWMGSLVFRSPRQAVAQIYPAAKVNPSNTPAPMNPPKIQPRTPFPRPQVTPPAFHPPQIPQLPTQAHGLPRRPQFKPGPAPPVVDGSIGWPAAEPDPPSPKK